MASRFYSVAFVLITGIFGLCLSPNLPFVNAQYQMVQERKAEADRLLNFGTQQYYVSQFSAAIQSWQQALTIYREIKNSSGEGAALGNLGIAYKALGKYDKAIDYQLQSVAIARETKDRLGEGQALGNLGNAYKALGKYDKAIEYHLQNLAIAREIKNRQVEGKALGNLGNTYHSFGQYDKEIEFDLQDLAIAREIGDRQDEGVTLGNLGNAYYSLGQYDKAIEFDLQDLAIAQEIKDRSGEMSAITNLGETYSKLNRDREAMIAFKQALIVAKEIGDREIEGYALANLGRILSETKQPDLAILFYKQSVNVREAIRNDIRKLDKDLQKSYLNTVANDYHKLADLLVKQGRIIEVLQVLDLLKVQELDDYLKNIKGNDRTSQGIGLFEPEKAFSDKLSTTNYEQIPELNRLLADQIQQLPKSEIDKPPEYLQKLPQGIALLYPLILDERIEIVIFSANSPASHRSVNIKKATLEELIGQFRSDLQDSTSLDVKDSSQKLYDILIKPVEEDLKQAKANTILYAPDGLLRYIPLAALYDSKQWLVEKYRINNLIAYSLFDQNSKPQSNPSIFAGAFGNGNKGNTEFTPLPATITEVNNIKSTFPNTTKFTEQDFTAKASINKAVGNAIVHLATHAKFQSGSPLDSYVLFGDGGKVTLSAISDWNLKNVDLVVLSACQTGLGASSNGAEILGFGYQVQKAGAKASIASLWTVSDGGTQLLMKAFYENLKKGSPSLSTSLREAQLSMIHRPVNDGEPNFNHPYYWAAFVLIGNGL